MTGRMMLLVCWFIVLACIVPLIMSLFIAVHVEFNQTISRILSTEVVTPALILVSALMVYFVRKSRTA